jgi:hypothetical protein
VREILIDDETVIIKHSIPLPNSTITEKSNIRTNIPGYLLRSRSHDSPLRRSRCRVDFFTTGIQNPGLQPLFNQPQKRSIIDACFEHTNHQIMIDLVEKAFDVVSTAVQHWLFPKKMDTANSKLLS